MLSQRESELLCLIANNPGMSQKNQALAMGIAVSTIEIMHYNIRRLTGVSNSAELAVYAVLSGFRQGTVIMDIGPTTSDKQQAIAKDLKAAMVKVLEAHA